MNEEAASRQITIFELLAVFRRQFAPMLVILIVALGLGYVVTKSMKPMYRASMEIMVEGRAPVANNDPIQAISMPGADMDVQTQIEVLQGARLLTSAMDKAGIPMPNELNPDAQATLPEVKVDQVNTTNAMQVSVDSSDPDVAQKVAQAIPQVYLHDVQTSRQTELDNALSFLASRQTIEQNAVRQAEFDLEAFKKQRTLLPLEQEGLQRSSKVGLSDTDAARTQASVANAQERLDTLIKERAALPNTLRTPTTQANTPEIEAQKTKISELQAQKDALLERYMPDNSEVVQVDVQIKDAQKRLLELPKMADATSVTRHPEILELDSRIADARATLKGAQAEQAKISAWASKSAKDLQAYNTIEPKQNELTRRVDDHKEALTGIRRELDALQVRRNATHDPVSVLAATPASKIRPRPTVNMIVAGALGLLFAIAFALIKDNADDRLTSQDQIYEIAGAPPLGSVPALPRRSSALARPSTDPTILESYRVLRFNLLFSTLENPIRSILVTSTALGEGKTELACNLAVAAAGEDRRVILVDGNLRNPTIHKMMNVDGKPGLTDVVLGTATLEESLHQTTIPGLSVLTAGESVSATADLLASARMREVYEQLIEKADLVIFDSSHCTGSADTLILANTAGSVLYVAREGSTRRKDMRRGIDSLRQTHARVLGVALSARGRKRAFTA